MSEQWDGDEPCLCGTEFTCLADEHDKRADPAPVDWSARFRAAADAAEAAGLPPSQYLRGLAVLLNAWPPRVVETIGRELTGGESATELRAELTELRAMRERARKLRQLRHVEGAEQAAKFILGEAS